MTAKPCTFSLLAVLWIGFVAQAAEVRGVITSADGKKMELTIDARGRGVRGLSLTFVLDKNTDILAGRKPARVEDLTKGKHVRIVYEMQDGRRVAVRVLVQGGGGAPAVAVVPPAGNGDTVAGILRRVAYTDREIVVIQAGKGGTEVEVTLRVPEGVKITRNQKPITFEELGESEQVTVQIETKDGKRVAQSIQVGVGAAAAPAAASDRKEKIERVRQILKMIDYALQRLGDR
jgi:hypothetical protein